jgi:hypothetical protein
VADNSQEYRRESVEPEPCGCREPGHVRLQAERQIDVEVDLLDATVA